MAVETKITADMTINDVIKKYPATIGVFNKFRLDSCCGGAQTLEKSAAEAGVSIEELLANLNASAS